jgi:hypothetical protein
MANYTLILDDDLEEDFGLIAIHCAAEDYKMAYLCNRSLNVLLKRKKTDLDFSREGLIVTFPWFEYENPSNYVSYDLIKNSCRSLKAHTLSSGGLFSSETQSETTTYLLPELRRVDYFLKISGEGDLPSFRPLLNKLKKIDEVISAYEVDTASLKSINNLIFD